MPQVSLNLSAASCAMAKAGPRPSTYRELRSPSALRKGVQSAATALAKASGSDLSELTSTASPVQWPRTARPATTELTKLLVAATDCSLPALRSMVMLEAAASGESLVLVSAIASAPLRLAESAMATMSGLLPDCEIEIAA